MKHVFYVVYVLSYSVAVFIAGMFVGQLLERIWSRRQAEAKRKVGDSQEEPVVPGYASPGDQEREIVVDEVGSGCQTFL